MTTSYLYPVWLCPYLYSKITMKEVKLKLAKKSFLYQALVKKSMSNQLDFSNSKNYQNTISCPWALCNDILKPEYMREKQNILN